MKKIIITIISVIIVAIFGTIIYLPTSTTLATVNGGCSDTSSPNMQSYFGDNRKITFCDGGDVFKGVIKSESFKAGKNIFFSYSGYPSSKNIQVLLKSKELIVQEINLPSVGERWVKHSLDIPDDLVDVELYLEVIDDSVQVFGWAGITNVEKKVVGNTTKFLIKGGAYLFFILMFLSLIFYLTLEKFGELNASVLVVLIFGMLGYLTFNLYVIDFRLGKFSAISLLLLSISLTVWIVFKGNYWLGNEFCGKKRIVQVSIRMVF
jgi:hypothetical protein